MVDSGQLAALHLLARCCPPVELHADAAHQELRMRRLRVLYVFCDTRGSIAFSVRTNSPSSIGLRGVTVGGNGMMTSSIIDGV